MIPNSNKLTQMEKKMNARREMYKDKYRVRKGEKEKDRRETSIKGMRVGERERRIDSKTER